MLTTSALRFAWPAGPSLGPLDLELGPGVHRVEGPNGTGKTTLLRLLCGALRPASGQVRVLGRDVHADARARAAIGWVPVHPELPDLLTVDEAWQLMAGLRDRPDWDGAGARRDLGLPGEARLGTLSAGQRRRAELLAALAGDPPVLLLDEPFADLDVAGVALLAAWIGLWRGDRCVVLVHHGEAPVGIDSAVGLS
jgi:ABC-type multidrug transport system ATPase subunit